jgi:hypothetical protein
MIFKLKILFVVFEWYFIQNFRIRKRLPDFSWYNIPKRGNSYRMSKNISKCCKIDQMSIKVTNIFIARPSRIYPNCDPENIPSGNPVRKRSENFSAEMEDSWNPTPGRCPCCWGPEPGPTSWLWRWASGPPPWSRGSADGASTCARRESDGSFFKTCFFAFT